MTAHSARCLPAALVLTCLLAACGKAPDSSTVTKPLALPPDATAAPASNASPPEAGAGAAAAPASAAATAIPTATDDIWKALDKQGAALEKAVDGGMWKDVPGRADAIRDLVAALPAHASKQPADAQAKLQQQVTLVATYAGKLDAAANAGDAAGAKSAYKKLNDVLGGLTRFP